MPVCQGCGGSYADTLEFCPNCGRVRPERPGIDIRLHLDDSDTDTACPVCRRVDEVQKISAMPAEKLARARLFPPAAATKRRQSAGTTALLVAGGILVVVAAFFTLLAVIDPPPGVVWVCIGTLSLIGVPCLALGLNRRRRETAANEAEFIQKMADSVDADQLWGAGYYCARDDCLYYPGQDEAYPASLLRG